MEKIKRILTSICLAATCAVSAQTLDYGSFSSSDAASKPWCYWWWVNGNVDKETIKSDLEFIEKIGFGGCLMFDARGYWEDSNHLIYPKPACEFMDDFWREHFKYSIELADSLGLEFSANLSSCAGRLKGPWLVGADAPKRLVCKITPLSPDSAVRVKAELPDREYAWPVDAYAVKYEGDAVENGGDWLDAGDGLYSMYDTSGKSLSQGVKKNRTALELKKLEAKDGFWDIETSDGNWALIQFACTTFDGHDYDVDVLDADAVGRYYKKMAGALKSDLGDLYSKTLTHFYSVSWEGAVPTWTTGFKDLFKNYAGYDIDSKMPVLAGFVVDSDDSSEKFMTDFRRARNMTFRDNFYGRMKDLAHEDGLKWHSESGGPWSRKPQVFGEADQMSFLGLNDMPQGEFWSGKKSRFLVKPIANAARIYGRNLVAVESFTHMEKHWSVYPSRLKPDVDAMFCDGGNRVIWHTFTSSPKEFGEPGIEYFAGSHINKNVTWSALVRPFLDYITRCQYMLSLGSPVVDFCVYLGDMPYQGWGRWRENFGDFSKIKIPQGYDYDILNNDVLINSAKLENGKLTLAGGMSYSAMIVELESPLVSPAALAKILEFKKVGFPVICIGNPPQGAAGLGENSALARKLGAEIFDGAPTFEEYMKDAKKSPDFEGDFDSIHRSTPSAEIYFVSGSEKGRQTFRSGGIPELWNPLDGSRNLPRNWKTLPDGRTEVELNLPQNGSIFVVFREGADLSLPIEKSDAVKLGGVSGDWLVEFQEGRGAPKSSVFKTLAPLNENEDFGIRHFSGTASYKNKFTLEQNPEEVFINIGDVGFIAEVFVNGQNCGIAWTYPFEVDVSKAVKAGENELEIRATNTWVNRLIGDASLPPEKRITKSNMALSPDKSSQPYSGFGAKDELQKSGLIGPVQIFGR